MSTNSTPAYALGRTPRMQVQVLGDSERDRKKFGRFVDHMDDWGLARIVSSAEPKDVLVLTDLTGRVKGVAACYDEGADLHVDGLYVMKQERGGGTKLMEAVTEFAKRTGKSRVTLESVPDAVNFYTKLGFHKPPQSRGGYLTLMNKAL